MFIGSFLLFSLKARSYLLGRPLQSEQIQLLRTLSGQLHWTRVTSTFWYAFTTTFVNEHFEENEDASGFRNLEMPTAVAVQYSPRLILDEVLLSFSNSHRQHTVVWLQAKNRATPRRLMSIEVLSLPRHDTQLMAQHLQTCHRVYRCVHGLTHELRKVIRVTKDAGHD
ncbi:hypothetical protein KC329_g72 [Hortaea werneckii]|nr:hypothetical protein KC329_g72 [Hortaea werneckii]